MKTALQQLNDIIGTTPEKIPINFIKRKIELLIEIEKKQIIDAYLTGADYCFASSFLADEYYNKNFKK